MPITSEQLAAGANYTLMSYAANDPVDNFTKMKPFMDWLIRNKEDSVFGNGIFNEKVIITDDSNYQNYSYDDQVSYNKRDPNRLAPFQHYEAHDGFTLNETELANNGVIVTDDKEARVTEAEKIQIVDKLKANYRALKNGFQKNFDEEMHRDGSASAKAAPGLDLLISTTPASTTVGGLDASLAANAFWRNQVNTGISTASAGTLTAAMEKTWRDCMTVGGMAPDAIFVGSKFLDAYRADALNTINRQLVISGRQGTNVDNSTTGVYFKGVELIWDPTFDTLQAADDPTVDWDKRCYFLNSQALKLRPFKGRWMIRRNPPRVYDRYTHYWGLTADYALTTNQRNCQAVLSIA